MTFGQKESSRQKGKPVSLFLIRYGAAAANYYAVTDHTDAILHQGVNYLPFASTHTGIKRMLTLDDTKLTFTLPKSHPLATRWRAYPPTEVTSVALWHGHVEDAEFKVVWVGRVLGHKDNRDGTADFTCEPRHTALARSGLTRNWQYGCPHLLYSQGEGLCNANKAAATTVFPAVTVNGPTITLGGGWAALGASRLDYITGMVEWTTADLRYEARTILRVAEDGTLTLNGPAVGLDVAMNVNTVLGCNHKAYSPGGDCERLHGNVPNFGGQPLIPTTNPIGIKNPYY